MKKADISSIVNEEVSKIRTIVKEEVKMYKSVNEAAFKYDSGDYEEVETLFTKITGRPAIDLDNNMFARSGGSADGDGEGWMLNIDDTNISASDKTLFVKSVMRLGKLRGWKIKQYGDDAVEIYEKESINEEDQIRKVVRSIINEELNEMDNTKPGDVIMFRGESMKVLDIDDVGNHKLEDKTGRVKMFNLSQIKQGTFTPEKREITTVELNESKVRKIIKESVEKELQEINKLAEYEVFESKLEKIAELIEKKSARLNRIDEDEDLKALTDKKKVKELQKDIKKLEKAKAKIEKALAKKAKSTPKKKEVIDEDEPISEVASEDAEATSDAAGEAADEFERAAAAAKELDDALEEEMSSDYTENENKAIDIAKSMLSSSPSLDMSSLARTISQKFPGEEDRIEDTLTGYDFYSNI